MVCRVNGTDRKLQANESRAAAAAATPPHADDGGESCAQPVRIGYYTPSGRSIQAKGIEPDVVVEEELPDDLKKLGAGKLLEGAGSIVEIASSLAR
jgi:hypothetical protein